METLKELVDVAKSRKGFRGSTLALNPHLLLNLIHQNIFLRRRQKKKNKPKKR